MDSIILPTHAQTTCASVTGFSGNFSPENWATSNSDGNNGTVDTSGAPASILITSGAVGFCDNNETLFCITVLCSGTISFDWSFDTDDESIAFPPFEEFGTNVNGTFNSLADSFTVPDGNTGETVIVNAGDVFCFSNLSNDCQDAPAFTTISNFSFSP